MSSPGRPQGRALGLIANIEALGAAVVPLIWGYCYDATVGWQPAFPFWMTAGIVGLGFCCALGLRIPSAAPSATVTARAAGAQVKKNAT